MGYSANRKTNGRANWKTGGKTGRKANGKKARTGITPRLLLAVNRLFKPPAHPFNMRRDGGSTYAEWQFDKGADTVKFYTEFTPAKEMFDGKRVLDVGCGAAGKSLYYVSLGAVKVTGLELLERYRGEAVALAARKGYADRFEFVCADAAATGLESRSYDTVIMNDAMEHVAEPEAVLRECMRLLAPGGRLYLNFPPYYHPYGAHLSDAVGIPWVHVFFGEKTLVAAYKLLVAGLPDGAERISFRISKRPDGGEYFSYINRMTVRRFRRILGSVGANEPGYGRGRWRGPESAAARLVYYREAPLRGVFKPLALLPGAKEFFVKMVVAVLEPHVL